MRSYVGAFLLAMVVAAALTPLARLLAVRVGAVSMPGGRHVHQKEIPRLGGVAIALAFCAPIAALFFLDTSVADSLEQRSAQAYAALIGGAALCVLGIWDDTRGVRASGKLAVQLLAAGLAFALGFRIDAVSLPFIGHVPMGAFALPVTVCWIVGITNAVNLIDGLDGLAAGVAFFAALTNFVVAYVSGSVFVALFMASMMGAVVGFLFYNFNPARIFMGDSGSYFLGFILATMSLAGAAQKASTTVALLVPMVTLGIPIFDTLFSMVRRFLERRSIFSPDNRHVHHRLLEMGLTHRRAVLTLYFASMLLTAAAIGISLGRSWTVGVALLSVSVVMLVLIRFAGYFRNVHLARRREARIYDSLTQGLRWNLKDMLDRIAAAPTERDALDALTTAAEQCGICGWTLATADGTHQEAWRRPGTQRDLARIQFVIGQGGESPSKLLISVCNQSQELSAQAEVLLQVLADGLTRRLTELDSPYTFASPRAAGDPEQEGSQEAAADSMDLKRAGV